ncbi:MAG: hypothetical protein N3D18_13365 [Roseococcus sp.]|nr:hypothetical protein [Roseococcus sp.]
MAALASLATLASAGVGLYAQQQAAQAQRAVQRAQVENQRQQEEARQQQLLLQQEAEARARREQLARTIASTRARLAAGGIPVNEGSAATVQAGLSADAAAGMRDSEALYRARMTSGRASLLNPDMSTTTLLRALPGFGNALRSLLD